MFLKLKVTSSEVEFTLPDMIVNSRRALRQLFSMLVTAGNITRRTQHTQRISQNKGQHVELGIGLM